MASIDIKTTVGITHIELLDNPFVEKWTGIFSDMLVKYDIGYVVPVIPCFDTYPKPISDTLQDIQNLKDAICSINSVLTSGAKFPFDPEKITINAIRDDHDEGQKILNEIHRYFTTAGRTINECRIEGSLNCGSWTNDPSSKFTWNVFHESEFFNSHAAINTIVHELDQYQATFRKKQDIYDQMVSLEFSFNNKSEVLLFEKEAFNHILSEDYVYADDNEDLDVWVTNAILGKDYIEAYYDHDDPSQWDVTPINGHSGSFGINVPGNWHHHKSTDDNLVQRLVKSNKFQNWLKEYNVKYHPSMCGMPLGKVTRGKSLLNWLKMPPYDCPLSPWVTKNSNQWIHRPFEVILNV